MRNTGGGVSRHGALLLLLPVLALAIALETSGTAVAAPAVVATIPLSGSGPTSAAWCGSGGRIYVYVANSTSNSISVVDTTSRAEVLSIPVAGTPVGLYPHYFGSSKVYIGQQGPDALLVLDCATNTITKTIPLAAKPSSTCFNPMTMRLYVGFDGSNDVVVIDCATDTLMAGSIATGAGTAGLAVNFLDNTVYAARQGTDTVGIIDADRGVMTGTVTCGAGVGGLAADAETNKVYVVNRGGNSVSVINGADGTIIKTIGVGASPFGVVIAGRVYVSNYGSNSMSVIDRETDVVVAEIAVGTAPAGNTAFSEVYQVNRGSNNLSVISDPPGQTGNTWYLAEGSTAWGFSTYITIQNPNGAATGAEVTYMPAGSPNVTQTVALPANSQTTVYPVDVLGQADFSTMVRCTDATRTIAVDRTMKWTGPGAPSSEAHSSIGVESPATVWYLPEGSSAWGFECWLLVQNPNEVAADVKFTYMIEGEEPVQKTHRVEARTRGSFSMADDIGQKDASIMISSDQAVIPERSMYRNNRREGHESIGATKVGWYNYLAEGSTAWGFTTYLLVQNPNNKPTEVRIEFMGPSKYSELPVFTMPPHSRKTIRVNDLSPANGYLFDVSNTDVSMRFISTRPVLVERAMYWDGGTSQGEVCHDTIGRRIPGTTFFLPDGESSPEVETWILVQCLNAGAGDLVDIEITYLTPDGAGNVAFTDTVRLWSRKSYRMGDKYKGRAAVLVRATNWVVVERSMYWNGRGAGSNTMGVGLYQEWPAGSRGAPLSAPLGSDPGGALSPAWLPASAAPRTSSGTAAPGTRP